MSTETGLAAVAREIYDTIRRAGSGYQPGAPIFAGKLTKRRLMAFEDGAVLSSNCYNTRYEPVLLVEVPSLSAREELWAQICQLGLAGTRFYLFSDFAEYRAHVSRREIWKPLHSDEAPN